MASRSSDMLLPHLQGWRADRGMTQTELAEKAGVAASTVRRAERSESISPVNVAKIAKALGISVRELRDVDPTERKPEGG